MAGADSTPSFPGKNLKRVREREATRQRLRQREGLGNEVHTLTYLG